MASGQQHSSSQVLNKIRDVKDTKPADEFEFLEHRPDKNKYSMLSDDGVSGHYTETPVCQGKKAHRLQYNPKVKESTKQPNEEDAERSTATC